MFSPSLLKRESYRLKRIGAMQHPCLSLHWSLLAVYHLTKSEPAYPHKRTGWMTVCITGQYQRKQPLWKCSPHLPGCLFQCAISVSVTPHAWTSLSSYPTTYIHWCSQVCTTSKIWVHGLNNMSMVLKWHNSSVVPEDESILFTTTIPE